MAGLKLRATVIGAGRIGLYMGGCLLHAGWRVRFIGRKGFGSEIEENGSLILSNVDQQEFSLPYDNDIFSYKENLEQGDIEEDEFVIICVKRADSEKIAQTLAGLELPKFTLVSFQNGVENTKIYCDTIKTEISSISAIFGPNVIKVDQTKAHFRLATSNPIYIEQTEKSEILQNGFMQGKKTNGPYLECETSPNIRGMMYGKLMLNLNNPINALTGLPLKDELSNRDCRKVLSAAMSEALAVMSAHEISPVSVTPFLVPKVLPYLMLLPNFLYLTAAKSSLKIDSSARSSMWDDLASGRKTEIDYLNGIIVEMGKAKSVPTPVNETLCNLIKQAEEAEKKTPNYSPQELYNLIWPNK